MKTKLLTIGLSLLGVIAFAQKKEIRNAGKAVESGNYSEAKTLLQSVEGQISSEKDRVKGDFYLTKGKAFLANEGEGQSAEDLMTAGKAFKKAIELGEAEEGQTGLTAVRNALVNAAVTDQNSENYASASEKLYTSYNLNTKDTLHLYYAAANATNAKDYDAALKYYEQLKDLGFTGEGIQYTAVNKESGEVENFASKDQRDLYVKSGEYTKPGEEKLPSKKGEITRNIALIYLEQGQDEKAIEALQEAKEANPDDTALMLAEADIYYKMGDMDKYSSTVEKVIEKDPENATLHYNLGITAMQMKAPEKAIEHYKNAIKYDPEMTEAYINLASSILMKERDIITEMNGLGMSDADTKRYDELTEERKGIYKEAIPYLEKAVEKDPTSREAIQTLVNIYQQTGQDKKAEEYKKKLQ